MPQFSENDINLAKRRVMEMRNRASNFVEDKNNNRQSTSQNTQHQQYQSQNINETQKNQNQEKDQEHQPESTSSELGDLTQDKSFLVILIMIMLLSNEGADSKLILSLLYLLL